MGAETQITQNLCHSCGEGFETQKPSLIICPTCVARRDQVKGLLSVITPITTAAKRLTAGILDALSNRKFVVARELVDELHLQVLSDREEAAARKQRDRVKKQRWASRQPERRVNDQAISSRSRGK